MDQRDNSQMPLVFEFNKAKKTVPEQLPGVQESNQKKAEENAESKAPWNQPEGNKTEVLDDEGHRDTLNHY